MAVVAGEGATILLVDDDPSIVGMLSARLSKRGFSVITAGDGEEALEKMREQRPDLVVLDVMMPKMSGWEVARSMRHDPALETIKIVMLTAIGEGLSSMTAPLYDVDAKIDKPFDFRKLDQTIDRLLAE